MTPCELCGGACCETVFFTMPEGASIDRDWVRTRGMIPHPEGVEVPLPCPRLENGRCTCYTYRPDVCREYEVGGVACRTVVARRRDVRVAARIFKLMEEIP